jgi:hypothetical protein
MFLLGKQAVFARATDVFALDDRDTLPCAAKVEAPPSRRAASQSGEIVFFDSALVFTLIPQCPVFLRTARDRAWRLRAHNHSTRM